MTKHTRRKSLEQIIRAATKGVKEMGKLGRMEWDIEAQKQRFGQEQMAQQLAALPAESGVPQPCPRCCKQWRVRAKEVERTFTSLSGTHTLKRNMHYCEDCKEGFYPRDEELGLPKLGELSAEVEKMVLEFGINDPYGTAATRWPVHHRHIPISDNQFKQVVKRVGQQVEAADPVLLQAALQEPSANDCKTLYVLNDGGMVPMQGKGEWAETKLGMTFREENHLSHHEANRGEITQARYVAHLGEQEEFKLQLKAAIEVEKRAPVDEIVWLADGLQSNWTTAQELCPCATQILDFQHALQHATDCEKVLLNVQELPPQKKTEWETRLLGGNVQSTVQSLMGRLEETTSAAQVEALNDLVRYYRNNEGRMKYDEYLQRGLMIGSGPVEAAHRHVIQVRMKRSGQHWSPHGGKRMARLRAAYRTGGPEHFLEAIRWAYRETLRRPADVPKPPKRYASNR
jgi:hypothetical protein